jgi:hypothetical protein
MLNFDPKIFDPKILLRAGKGLLQLLVLLCMVACTDKNKLIDTNSQLLSDLEWQQPIPIGPSEAIEVQWKLRGEGDHFLKGNKLSLGVAIVPDFYPKPSQQEPRIFEKLTSILGRAAYFHRTEPKEIIKDANGIDLVTGELLLTPEIFKQARAAHGSDFNRRTAIILIWYAVDEAGVYSEFAKRGRSLRSIVYGQEGKQRKSKHKTMGAMKLLKAVIRGPMLPTEIEEEFKDYTITFQHRTNASWIVIGDRLRLAAYQ